MSSNQSKTLFDYISPVIDKKKKRGKKQTKKQQQYQEPITNPSQSPEVKSFDQIMNEQQQQKSVPLFPSYIPIPQVQPVIQQQQPSYDQFQYQFNMQKIQEIQNFAKTFAEELKLESMVESSDEENQIKLDEELQQLDQLFKQIDEQKSEESGNVKASGKQQKKKKEKKFKKIEDNEKSEQNQNQELFESIFSSEEQFFVQQSFSLNQQEQLFFQKLELFLPLIQPVNDSGLKLVRYEYESYQQYQQTLIPLMQNEYRQAIQDEVDMFIQNWTKSDKTSMPDPLEYNLIENNNKQQFEKILVYEMQKLEDPQNQLKNNYENSNYLEFLDFQMSFIYIVVAIKYNAQTKSNQCALAIACPVCNRICFVNSEKNLKMLDFKSQEQFTLKIQPIVKPIPYHIELNSILSLKQSRFLNYVTKFLQNIFYSSDNIPQQCKVRNKRCARFLLRHQTDFNESQKTAIKEACNFVKPITLIQGPPGTGKTFTSLGIMNCVINSMKKSKFNNLVIATSHSNTVINDWLLKIQTDKLFSENKYPLCVKRIGVIEKCSEETFGFSLELQAQKQFFIQQFSSIQQQQVLPPSLEEIKRQIKNLTDYLAELKTKKQLFGVDNSVEAAQLLAYRSSLKQIYKNMWSTLVSNYSKYQTIQYELLNQTDLMVCTISSIQSTTLAKYLKISKRIIELCIIDEAPQSFEPSCIIPFQYPIKKMVLIGDEKQLGPTVISHDITSQFGYDLSFFERILHNDIVPFLLNEQYRSQPNLNKCISYLFYNNKVKDSLEVKKRPFPSYLSDNFTIKNNFIFIDMMDSQEDLFQASYFNQTEITLIKQLVYLLFPVISMLDSQKVSIISPYKAQVNLLKLQFEEELKSYLTSLNKPLSAIIDINTVDSFQGKENDIIILSLVRTEAYGFLSDKRRINVSTSRAKYIQIILGHSPTLLQNAYWKKLINYMKGNNMYKHYLNSEPNDQIFASCLEIKNQIFNQNYQQQI